MDTGIEADCQMEFHEFYRAVRWYTWRKFWWLYCILIVVPTITIVTTFFRPSDEPSGRFVANVPTLIIPVLLVALYYWGIYRNARRQFNTSNSLHEARHYRFSEDGLEFSSPSSSGKLAWNTFHRIVEAPESFLFFTSNIVSIVLPKRTLGGEAKVQGLRNLVKDRAGLK